MEAVSTVTTIAVAEDVKRELLRVAAELQLKLGRKVDLNEAVRYLVAQRRRRDPMLLKEACRPQGGARAAIDELWAERIRDDERTERKTGLGH